MAANDELFRCRVIDNDGVPLTPMGIEISLLSCDCEGLLDTHSMISRLYGYGIRASLSAITDFETRDEAESNGHTVW